MAEKIFELKGVSFSYLGRFPALSGVDFSAEKGTRIAVIGANGTGKSTLLHVLAGLIFPDGGEVSAFGSRLSEAALADPAFNRSIRKRIGIVFQNPDVQLFCPTVREEILFGPLNFGVDMAEIRPALGSIMDLFGIAALADRMPHQLSVGEKRKVAMASVFISGPEAVLLDEPTAGLDPKTSRHLIELLNRYHADGKTVIIATHDMHLVQEAADLVYVFGSDRKIMACGETAAILKDGALLEAHNLVHVHAHRHRDAVHVHPHEHPSHDHEHKG